MISKKKNKCSDYIHLNDKLDINREFNWNYLYIDLCFLIIYISILIYLQKFTSLFIGTIFAITIYIIDAQIWFKTGVREYKIVNNDETIDNKDSSKFFVDFMMTISYGIIAFSWNFIIFENISLENINQNLILTIIIFMGWMLIPFISMKIPEKKGIVCTVRHMQYSKYLSIITTIIGYSILLILQVEISIIFIIFLMGCFQSFAMEFPLMVFKIRDINLETFSYEIFFLINQGIPYIYIIHLLIF